MDERRKFQRIDLPSKIRYAIPAPFPVQIEAAGRTMKTHACDISAAGIGVESPADAPAAKTAVVTLVLLGRTLTAEAEIRYSRLAADGKYRWGLHFVKASEEVIDTIGRYILNELAPYGRSRP